MEPKLGVSWLESRQIYRDKLFALFDRRQRGSGKPLIQRGADDAASHLLGGGRDLVAWPEFLGLFAALTGERGRSARTAGSLEGAIVSILGTYAPQNAYYGSRYPALASRFPPTRLLTLSLTDTFGRAVLEPFSGTPTCCSPRATTTSSGSRRSGRWCCPSWWPGCSTSTPTTSRRSRSSRAG